MKRILVLLVSMTMVYSLSGDPLQWDQYLGNPGRTAYIDYEGPDSPEILWEVELSCLAGNPFISKDRVVVECGGKAVLIDLLTDTLLSEATANVESLTGAYPVGDTILGTTRGGWLYRINPVTGDAPFDVKIPDRFHCFVHCPPIVLSDRMIFPSTPVVCLSRDDYSTLWDLQSSLGPLYPEDGEVQMIAASSKRLYIVIREVEEKKIWTVDSDTGEFLWAKDGFEISVIATDGSVLFAGGEGLYALDTETGELLWLFEFESDYLSSNIVVGPHAVYATDEEKLYSVDKTTGVLNWKVQWEGNPFWITYIVGMKNIVICSDVRNLSCFSAEDGTEIWNIHFADFIDLNPKKPCPAAAKGILIVGGKEGSNRILALASDPDLFVKQGDAFLSEGMKDQAIDSYKKAAQLYEKEGNLNKSQEMQQKVYELENQQESTSEPSTPPESPPVTFNFSIVGIVVLAVTLFGIFIVYYFVKRKEF